MNISIERAAIADAAEVANVCRDSRKHSLSYLPNLHTANEDVDFFRNSVFGANTVFIAVNERRRIVGFIAFGEGWVNHLYLLPDFQRLGIGGRLLEKAKEEWPALKLWTFERNRGALRFYEKHGFSIMDRTDGAGNEEKEPDILLQFRR